MFGFYSREYCFIVTEINRRISLWTLDISIGRLLARYIGISYRCTFIWCLIYNSFGWWVFKMYDTIVFFLSAIVRCLLCYHYRGWWFFMNDIFWICIIILFVFIIHNLFVTHKYIAFQLFSSSMLISIVILFNRIISNYILLMWFNICNSLSFMILVI